MGRKLCGSAALLGAAIVAAGCSDSTAPVDEAALALVADQTAGVTAEQVGKMRHPGVPGWGFPRHTIAGVDRVPKCPLQNGTYLCTSRHGDGTTEIQVTFMDASGQAQEAFDETTTASVHVVTASQYTRERETSSGFRMRTSDFTVSGLQGEEITRIWNGTSSGESSRTSEARGSSQMTFSSVVTDVVIPHPKVSDTWPTSGVITSDAIGSHTNADGAVRDVVTDIEVVFNGTQFPEATLNGEVYELDLAARRGHHKGGRHHKGQGKK